MTLDSLYTFSRFQHTNAASLAQTKWQPIHPINVPLFVINDETMVLCVGDKNIWTVGGWVVMRKFWHYWAEVRGSRVQLRSST
jgi:hypothetical protein